MNTLSLMRCDSAEFVVGAVSPKDFPDDGCPEIVFSGRSNVGKSSLINCLLQRKNLARTSSVPGKTQQLNYYRVNEMFYFVDLPGYGYVRGGKDLREKLGHMVESYVKSSQQICAILQLIDARHGPTDSDRVMIELLRSLQFPFLLVFTKTDKLSRPKLNKVFSRLESEGVLGGISYVQFSAESKQGREDVLCWIDDAVNFDKS
ncbi:MAG: ribosome biogenesis GTP-binding protein YihA/YsxC [Candidatus Latescibacterota bacterium]|nr:ribosome biogenesis GTP-binding protein YihA/YsxC [Candidatus Latescibacterota bacterium]